MPTPGHTAGHAALLVRDAEQSWLLAGDLAHTAEEVEDVAPEIAGWCRAEGIEILTAHDSAALCDDLDRSVRNTGSAFARVSGVEWGRG